MRNDHLAALLLIVYLLVVGIGRSLLQRRWTGSLGWRPLGRGAPAVAWVAEGLLVAGGLAGVAGLVLQLSGRIAPLEALGFAGARPLALALYAVGFAGTFVSQLSMGRSWRVGVDPDERTELVTRGPFRRVRHPIYTSLTATLAGGLLLVPNPVALAALPLVAAGLVCQVRGVEEPHLERLHGDRYRAWAARSGRFLPWLGRLRR